MSSRLADFCQAIVDCEHKTAPEGDGFALSVGTRGMKDGRLVVEACKPVSEETYIEWTRRMTPIPGDLVLAREAPVGQVVRVPSGHRICLGQRTVLIRPDATRVHPRFLHYWLLGPDAQGPMAAKSGGATVAHLNVEDIRNLDVGAIPEDRRVQDCAASVLGAIDDLIENNVRRVRLLDDMANTIYRGWFVEFRYPRGEKPILMESPLGSIPDGWDTVPLVEEAQITMGQSPKSEFYNADGIGMPFHQGVTDFGHHFPTHRKYCTASGRTAKEGDVLVSVRAPVGRLNLADASLVIGRGLAAVRSRSGRQSLLFAQLKDVFAEEDSMGGGTIFKAIGKRELEQLLIFHLPLELARRADDVLSENSNLIRTLTFQNRCLAEIRSFLLPRLVAGRIHASTLDSYAPVEDSVA